MKDRDKTKEQLIHELSKLRRHIAEQEPAKDGDAPRESRSEFYSVFDNTPIAMVLVDGERRVQWANLAALEFTGRRAESIKGLRGGEALRCIHAVEDERGCGFGPSCEKCEIRRMVLETIETNHPHRKVQVELRISIEEEEETLSLLVSTIPLTLSGARRVLVCIDDVTWLKQAEENALAQSEFVRRIIESLPHPFYVIDVHDYTVKMANPAAIKGALPPRITCHSLTHNSPTPCNTTKHPCPVREIRKTKEPRTVEHLHRDKEGAERAVEVHCYPIFDREENVVQIIEYAVDVTERKKAEEADRLKRLSEMLINFQEEERRRVARDLHDELGQVLTAIKITLGMILKDHPELDDAIREELEETIKIMDSAMRFTRTISTRLRPEMLDSLGLIPSIEHEVAFAEKRSGVRIQYTGPGLRARLDPKKEITLYRVVQEALNNIFKHAEASEAEVSIREEDGSVVLQVRDNGRGVKEVDIQTSRGLGVLGMRERIASVGGTFTIRARPGGGTVLESRVPIGPSTQDDGTGDTR